MTAMQRLKNERLRRYLEAEEAVLAGQKYQIGNREMTLADLNVIQKVIKELMEDGANMEDEEISPNMGRTKRVVFYDG